MEDQQGQEKAAEDNSGYMYIIMWRGRESWGQIHTYFVYF